MVFYITKGLPFPFQSQQYKCDKCKKKNMHKKHLKQHIKSSHDSIGKVTCEDCGANINANNMARHKDVRAKKYHQCAQCLAKYWDRSHLLRHIKKKH